MELTPCATCGESAFVPEHAVVEVEGDLASQYAGRCPRCRAPREFLFRIPEDVILPDEDDPVFGDEQPSQLIDAGQWVWLADRLTAGVPAEPGEDMTAVRRRQLRRDLLTAAAAVAEAIKFVPAGADAVPRAALWSETGHAAYLQEPGRFHRRRLDAVSQTYRRIAQRFGD